MANTTNFNWETPDDTDLVKDGAAAMRTLGNSIDSSFVDLKGGTTGQILSKASNTDLDYTWTTPSSGNLVLLNTTTFSAVSSQSINNVFSSTYDNYVLYFYYTDASANHNLKLFMRVSSTDTGMTSQMLQQYSTTITGSDNGSGSATAGLLLSSTSGSLGAYASGKVDILSPNLVQRTTAYGNCLAVNASGQPYQYRSGLYTDGTTSFTGFTLSASSGTISGNIKVYGVKN